MQSDKPPLRAQELAARWPFRSHCPSIQSPDQAGSLLSEAAFLPLLGPPATAWLLQSLAKYGAYYLPLSAGGNPSEVRPARSLDRNGGNGPKIAFRSRGKKGSGARPIVRGRS